MKMNRNEMEALYAFGCPNLKATVERLRMVFRMMLLSAFVEIWWQVQCRSYF